jgi:hypothetical protein
MAKPKVSYVSKEKLYPAFGEALVDPPRIKIRKDLPKNVKRFVLAHEKYHLKDWERCKKKGKKYSVFLGEIRASFFPAFRYPLGFLLTIILSLQPYRLRLYFNRIFLGKAHYGNRNN